jgi:hypothetical protein
LNMPDRSMFAQHGQPCFELPDLHVGGTHKPHRRATSLDTACATSRVRRLKSCSTGRRCRAGNCTVSRPRKPGLPACESDLVTRLHHVLPAR